MLKQLDLFADFLETAWAGAKIDVQPIEQHPNMQALHLIAYQEWLDWSGSGEPQGLFLIIEGPGKTPYHFGGAGEPPGLPARNVVNPNCIEQQYMLSHPGRWRLKLWGEKDVQWTPWVWKNRDAEQQFMNWHSKQFASWTKEAWEAAKKRGTSWRPNKEG
ncbi:hypothetical protein [Paenibacillus sp. P46E]|uniref:hypothetical protein n=1 Tax=Paenibacillus sp. P46E TaxID=1349436 RepID=UPI00093F9797|nr:hypothetical protein [Paenibacillus sp. P46E]OKP97737.1 hypothetical protein A3849_13605 [Paenibacillus sp. P46E]